MKFTHLHTHSHYSLLDGLAKIDQLVEKTTNADSTGIYILDEKTNSVVLRASKLHFAIVGKLKMKLGEGITGWVAKYGKSVVIEKGAAKNSLFKRIPDLPDDLFESFLSVPIKSGNVVVGVINVKHKLPHKYPKDQAMLLEMIGKLVGRAVEHNVLLEKAKNLEEALQTHVSWSKQHHPCELYKLILCLKQEHWSPNQLSDY